MALIKSISGIRGTIGGKVDDGLNPLNIVKFVCGYFHFLTLNSTSKKMKIIVGRDARISGDIVNSIVCNTLLSLGADVVDAGLSTTPTVEMAVIFDKADGGIIITASHNPKNWNALKLLNNKGEFLSAKDGENILEFAENLLDTNFATVENLGHYRKDDSFIQKHIDEVLKLDLVDVEAIKNADFSVVIDTVNSTGSLAIPNLLTALGVKKILNLNAEANGNFAHNPEPLPENITEICREIKTKKADIGFVVDPDVDRLAIVDENGEAFGEEYTLVAVADYVLKSKNEKNLCTVSNLSSSRALKIIAKNHNGKYFASAVGEVNVVEKMKANNAIIGGEGNGGVIYPELHYGRDALVGIALFLSLLAKAKKKTSEIRKKYPNLIISKNKIDIDKDCNFDEILHKLIKNYKNKAEISTVDGVKLDFPDYWIHIRKSNTEPIIRIYCEHEADKEVDLSDLFDILQNKKQ